MIEAMSKAYRARVLRQTRMWAMGWPSHNNVDDECCPDFSCCNPDLFEPDAKKRWDTFKAEAIEFSDAP